MIEYFDYSVVEDNSSRIDNFLTEVSEFSRNKIKNSIIVGNVKVNGETVLKPSYKLKIEDSVVMGMEIEKSSTLREQKDVKLSIIYEDEYILVVDKPAYLVCHPGIGNPDSTLANYVFGYLKTFPFLVHRLDKDTSGVIVFAKTEKALTELQALWKDRKVYKYYQTLVIKTPDSKEGLIDSPLRRDVVDRQRIRISARETAKEAQTYFKIIESIGEYNLLNIRIFTGRTHQIRVHLSSIGCGVAGDHTYGNSKTNKLLKEDYGLDRQFLHAWRLEFIHPFTNERLILESKLPNDLEDVLKKLRNNKNVEL